jgi:hypothetical protein
MIELRILAIVGLIVTAIVTSLAVTGVAMLVQRIQRARPSSLERDDSAAPDLAPAPSQSRAGEPLGSSLERRARNRHAQWRLRC